MKIFVILTLSLCAVQCSDILVKVIQEAYIGNCQFGCNRCPTTGNKSLPYYEQKLEAAKQEVKVLEQEVEQASSAETAVYNAGNATQDLVDAATGNNTGRHRRKRASEDVSLTSCDDPSTTINGTVTDMIIFALQKMNSSLQALSIDNLDTTTLECYAVLAFTLRTGLLSGRLAKPQNTTVITNMAESVRASVRRRVVVMITFRQEKETALAIKRQEVEQAKEDFVAAGGTVTGSGTTHQGGETTMMGLTSDPPVQTSAAQIPTTFSPSGNPTTTAGSRNPTTTPQSSGPPTTLPPTQHSTLPMTTQPPTNSQTTAKLTTSSLPATNPTTTPKPPITTTTNPTTTLKPLTTTTVAQVPTTTTVAPVPTTTTVAPVPTTTTVAQVPTTTTAAPVPITTTVAPVPTTTTAAPVPTTTTVAQVPTTTTVAPVPTTTTVAPVPTTTTVAPVPTTTTVAPVPTTTTVAQVPTTTVAPVPTTTTAPACDYSQFGSTHTMLLPPQTSCVAHLKEVSEADKAIILTTHNNHRATVARGNEQRGAPGPQPAGANIRELKWNEELAKVAQAWAEQCPNGHDGNNARKICSRDYAVGQNIYYYWGFNSSTFWKNAIDAWYNEVADMPNSMVSSFTSGSNNGKVIGHYTQVVWANTYEIGCGGVHYSTDRSGQTYPESKIYVCNYGPAGNFLNQEIYAQGTAASQCSDGVSTTYSDLCA